MDFAFDDDTRLLCEALRKFLKTEVLPLEEKHKDLLDGGKMSDEVARIGAGIRKKAVEAGFYTVHLPKELGGAGLPYVTTTALREEIAMSGSVILGLYVIGDPPCGPTPLLMLCNDEQRERFLKPLVAGDKTTCFALTEPGAGSDISSIQTMAVRDGDDWVLNGSKIYISNGMHADFFQVFALTKKPGPGEDAMFGCISLFMVDADSPGVERKLMKSMGGDDFQAEITFKDVRVPASNLVGDEGFGFLGAAQWLSGERLMMAIQAVGLARYALAFGTEWAKTRMAFGKPIGKNQGVSFPLADCATQIEAARWLTYRTAWLLDQGETAMTELAMAKVFAADVLGKVADQVMQTLGGIGYMAEHPIERIYRMARVFRIGGGTSEIQRRLIAKGLGL
ncbi:MAG: acyl-CoA dehydrogenase family protein [Deltaproteobacteria bacterium]|nr:acyl-CoA dehydrogenase family protein [Deltaproteobacteria bacterium]